MLPEPASLFSAVPFPTAPLSLYRVPKAIRGKRADELINFIDPDELSSLHPSSPFSLPSVSCMEMLQGAIVNLLSKIKSSCESVLLCIFRILVLYSQRRATNS